MSNQIENNINKFMLAKDRARQLIQMDMDGTLDKYKKNAQSINNSYATTQSQNNIVPKNTKLPLEIIESIQKNPINQNSINDSILTEIERISDKKIEDSHKTYQNEQIYKSNNTIDYSMIKMIVENCLKEYAEKTSIKQINESQSNDANLIKAMKIGNKFSFITANGDLYEAKLTFIKNIKNKKA